MKPLLHAIYRKIHFFSFSFLGGRQHFRFFTGLPIYGTRAEVPSRVSSRFSVPSIIAFPFRLEGPIAFAYYVKADIARAAAAASMLCAVPAMPNGNLRLSFALGALVCRLGVDPLCGFQALRADLRQSAPGTSPRIRLRPSASARCIGQIVPSGLSA